MAKAIKLAAASQKLWAVDDWENLDLITHIIHGTGIFNYMLVDFYVNLDTRIVWVVI